MEREQSTLEGVVKSVMIIDPDLLEMLSCPVERTPLRLEGGELVNSSGKRKYPIVQGIPVLFSEESNNTLECIEYSKKRKEEDKWMLRSLGMSDEQREGVLKYAEEPSRKVDPVVNFMVAATSGNMYQHLVGALPSYPIPHFPIKNADGKRVLDIGCNWGRWSIAAAREGALPIGLDPQLGALMAAKRVCEEMGVKSYFICADARYLPLKENSVDIIFSYSVLQHLSQTDVEQVLKGSSRVLKKWGRVFIQMPTKIGIKGFLHRLRKGFKKPKDFDVRYRSLSELRKTFEELIGKTNFSIDCFFGIGLQFSDFRLMPWKFKLPLLVSEMLRGLGKFFYPITWLADSVYVESEVGEEEKSLRVES